MSDPTKVCKQCRLTKPLRAFEKLPRGVRGKCYRCRQGKTPIPAVEVDPVFARDVSGRRVYIVTAAQNNTLARPDFLAALHQARKHYRAELIVVPFRYKNPTGLQPGRDLRGKDRCPGAPGRPCLLGKDHLGKHKTDELWWDPVLHPYLLNTRTQLCPNLVLAADVKIQATASSPLSSFEALTGPDSCIIGHPKLQLRSVAVGAVGYPKILTTTGVVTERNYSNTKAGALGEFHYCLGATLVEVDKDRFWLRQLLGSCDDGSFTDWNRHFTARRVSKAPRAKALICGDIHVDITDPTVDRATFGPGGIVEDLQPEVVVVHDLDDGGTVNPHESSDPFFAEGRRKAQRQDVLAEIRRAVEFVDARIPEGTKAVIVDSNHHDFLRRWVVKQFTHGCYDLKNARVFLESAMHMLDTAKMTAGGPVYGDPWRYLFRKLNTRAGVRCLEPDESFAVCGIECAMHGHNGPNGARGSMKNLARIGTRSVTAHRHFFGIEEGHWSVATSTPRRQSYHRGPGNNLNGHCTIYATGKRCLNFIIDGRARAKP